VKARTAATVGAGGRLAEVRCAPPLTLRQVAADDPSTCRLCLVGTAAGPLPGDDLELDLTIGAGASAELIATGAAIAQGRGAVASRLRLRAGLGEGASLRADPGALVVCEGARVDVSVELRLAAGATVHWRELVVLGRSTDAGPGRATIRWDVVRAGRPVLRQLVDLADPALRDWAGMTGGHRVVAGAFVSGPDVPGRTVVRSTTAVTQKIDATTALITVLGDSAAEVTRQLDELSTALLGYQAARA
jgi:urease accessory protein